LNVVLVHGGAEAAPEVGVLDGHFGILRGGVALVA